MSKLGNWNEDRHHKINAYISGCAGVLSLLLALFPPSMIGGTIRYLAIGLSAATIAWVDFYAVMLLRAAAYLANDPKSEEKWPGLPNRLPALVAVPLIFGALVLAFAALYLLSQDISSDKLGAVGTDFVRAIYFSLVTMTTLGFGDFAPQQNIGRIIVIAQLLSDLIFILMAFPILASRLAVLDDPAPVEKTVEVKRTDAGLEVIFDDGTSKPASSWVQIRAGAALRVTNHDGKDL